MPHNVPIPTSTRQQLILDEGYNLSQLLARKYTDTMLAPLSTTTRTQLKLLADLFQR